MNDIYASKGYVIRLEEEGKVLVFCSRPAAMAFTNWYWSSTRKEEEMPQPEYVIDLKTQSKAIVCPFCGSIRIPKRTHG